MGPNYACLFVGYMEERILSTYTGFIPQLYKRYIDDIVGAASCRRDELEGFITHVSTFHPTLQERQEMSTFFENLGYPSDGFTADRSGKCVVRHPPRSPRETCA